MNPILIRPDSSAIPGEWSPFEPDGSLDADRLHAEGWRFVGTVKSGAVEAGG